MANNNNKWQPFIYGVLISTGILIGMWLRPSANNKIHIGNNNKFGELMSIIKEAYVDSVNVQDLENKTINELLSNLDPHSAYIPAEDLQKANEPLEGNFDGIGVEFNIVNDTIMVVSAINGGPSQELGIKAGDRMINVDTINVASVKITNERVIKLLRGKRGTKVNVTIYRPYEKQKVDYTITRNTIPIYSIDAALMIDSETGYMKISRFAATTHDEFLKAYSELENQNIKNLILDLRGNPGGYLNAATELADEILDGKKLIVYTQGRTKPKQEFYTEKTGAFEEGKLIVLIDEGSASASEILCGAVQDWDRGLVIGRRSFGKGLVQEPFDLSDGSALRLTISRYYTPSGRCIQKDYKKSGYDEYENDIYARLENGELEDASKQRIYDSTPYHTKQNNRVVYGGGGIYPDVFVPIDTSYNSRFLTDVFANGMLNKYAYNYLDKNRHSIMAITDLEVYTQSYQISDLAFNQFIENCKLQGINTSNISDINRSKSFIKLQLKALIARQIWHEKGYYNVVIKQDKGVLKAITVLSNYSVLLNNK
ncbi:MAG: S41 family peptidase [Bacteroidetes bacterium]|nr:S41 family peptidase [Bacteroidota bacterium]